MVVQVQTTITQRRWSPTTQVTVDAWKENRHTHTDTVIKPPNSTATPPSISSALSHGYRAKRDTLLSTVGSSFVPICIQLTGCTASQPGLHTNMKGFYECFHVWWWAKAFPWKSNQLHHNELFQFFQLSLYHLLCSLRCPNSSSPHL